MKQFFIAIGSWWKQNVFTNPKLIIRCFFTLLIPFCYGFIYLSAFWDPFSLSKNIQVALVNQDTNDKFSKTLEKNFKENSAKILPLDTTFTETNKNYFENNKRNFSAALIIPPNFDANLTKFIEAPENSGIQPPNLTFYYSYKKNYVIAEGMNFLASELKTLAALSIVSVQLGNFLTKLDNVKDIDSIKEIFNQMSKFLGPYFESFLNTIVWLLDHGGGQDFDKFKEEFISTLQKFINDIETQSPDQVLNNLLNFVGVKDNIEGNKYNNYGFGLGPYFICIAMWIGVLTQTFWICRKDLFRNLKRKKDSKDGKWAFKNWKLRMRNFCLLATNSSLLSAIQFTILFIALTLLGFNVGGINQFYFYLTGLLMSISFSWIILAILYMFSSPDAGKFFVILFFILQLSACNGTFPITMENSFFQFVSSLCPFTHVIYIIRELLVNTSTSIVLIHILYLVLITLSFIILCFLVNIISSLIANRKYIKKQTYSQINEK